MPPRAAPARRDRRSRGDLAQSAFLCDHVARRDAPQLLQETASRSAHGLRRATSGERCRRGFARGCLLGAPIRRQRCAGVTDDGGNDGGSADLLDRCLTTRPSLGRFDRNPRPTITNGNGRQRRSGTQARVANEHLAGQHQRRGGTEHLLCRHRVPLFSSEKCFCCRLPSVLGHQPALRAISRRRSRQESHGQVRRTKSLIASLVVLPWRRSHLTRARMAGHGSNGVISASLLRMGDDESQDRAHDWAPQHRPSWWASGVWDT